MRDGHRYATPEPSEFRDLVIVGAGPNGLVSAYHLPDIDLVCLEKEARTGGNSQRSSWRGIQYTEGAAYTDIDSDLQRFMSSEFDIQPIPLRSNFGYVAGNQLIPGFYKGGFEQLPFPPEVRDGFRRFRDRCNHNAETLWPAFESMLRRQPARDADLAEKAARLEAMSFETWLKEEGFPQQLIDFCDAYCPTEINGYPRDMSALVGTTFMAGIGDFDGSATWPGGLAIMAEKLAAGVRAQGSDRIRSGSIVVNVQNTPDGRHVDVTYLQAGLPRTIRCKTCIWAGPNHMASFAVSGMPEEQRQAIRNMHYNDISVMNLCYDRRIYDGAYMTWLTGGPINNFLPADWVLNEGNVDPASPQVLTCDWANRREHRALLLDDAWVVEQCQAAARRMEEIFPDSLDHLVEIRLPLRAHSWVTWSPGYVTELKPKIDNDVGRVIITGSDQNTFERAYEKGLENARKARDWLN